jgi:hypothetical protein
MNVKSVHLDELRAQMIEKYDSRCDRCRAKDQSLELRHWTYRRLGHEWENDVQPLCPICQTVVDWERQGLEKTERRLSSEEGRAWMVQCLESYPRARARLARSLQPYPEARAWMIRHSRPRLAVEPQAKPKRPRNWRNLPWGGLFERKR